MSHEYKSCLKAVVFLNMLNTVVTLDISHCVTFGSLNIFVFSNILLVNSTVSGIDEGTVTRLLESLNACAKLRRVPAVPQPDTSVRASTPAQFGGVPNQVTGPSIVTTTFLEDPEYVWVIVSEPLYTFDDVSPHDTVSVPFLNIGRVTTVPPETSNTSVMGSDAI